MLYKYFIFISVAIRMAYHVVYVSCFLRQRLPWSLVDSLLFMQFLGSHRRKFYTYLELSGWLFVNIFKIKNFFLIIDSILLYLKGTQKNSVWIHTPSWCHWCTKNFWNFHLEVSGFLSRWRKAASIKEIQKFHFQCSFLSQEYQEVYSGSLLFPYNCPILTTCISSWTRAMVIVNWPIFFNLRLRASHF